MDSQKKLTPTELLLANHYKGKLTQGLQDVLVEAVLKGVPPRTALKARVSESTIRTWQRRADKGERKYAELFKALAAAEQQSLERVACNAQKLTEKDGRVALDYLSRRDPEHWSKRDEVGVKVQLNADAIFEQIAEARKNMVEGKWEVLATSDRPELQAKNQ